MEDNVEIIKDQLRVFGGPQKTAGDYKMVCCPFHQDRTPSCGIFLRRDHPKKTLGWFNCFAAETKVITRDGVFRISELLDKDVFVLTTGQCWVKTRFKSYGVQRLYELKVARKNEAAKSIYVTGGHDWYAVPNGRRGPIHERIKLTTRELPKGALLESVTPKRQRFSLSRTGIKHGFVFGDGTVKRQNSIAYFCNGKEELVHYFSEHTEGRYEYSDRIQIGNLPLEWKALPTEKYNDYLAGFLAGLLAADGCVSKRGGVSFSNKDIRVVEAVRDIAIKLGITVKRVKSRTRDTNFKTNATMCGISFSRSDFPKELLLRSKHRANFTEKDVAAELGFRVVSVAKTKRVEEVFCCNVPNTHTFALEDYILTGNCLGCGAHGGWNVFAEKTGLKEIKSWNSKETTVGYNSNCDNALLGDIGITLKAVYREMRCPEAQPWMETLDWRGVPGALIAAVGGKAINDEYNDGIAVLFPIKIGKKIRGAVKAMFHKRGLGYITMQGEWVSQFGLFPYEYTAQLIVRRKHRFVILVEGPRDALRLLRMGIPAIAVLGANTISRTKMLYIQSLGVDQIYVMPDNDTGGTALWKNIKRLVPDARRLKLPRDRGPDGKIIKMDPFSMPATVAKAVRQLLRQRHGWSK